MKSDDNFSPASEKLEVIHAEKINVMCDSKSLQNES